MAIADDVDTALSELESVAGETVTIDDWTGTALVTGGVGNFDDVVGGYYDKNAYVVDVRKTVLPAGFLPIPGMIVVARGKNLRIPYDGITDNRAHYRLTVVSRDAPK